MPAPTSPSARPATRPKLGDFVRPGSRPETPEPQPPPAAAEPAAAVAAEADSEVQVPAQTEQLEEAAKARLSLYEDMSQALLPVKDYTVFLKEQKIEESKAAEIVDDLITKGFHEETYEVTKRTSVVFRTRAHLDTLRLHAALQAQQPIYQDVAQELMIRYNMAASLAAIQGPHPIRFEFPTDKDDEKRAHELFDLRMRYIERMPGVLFGKLSIKLAEFDRLVAAVMREGVAEHF
jgi:hypothetical protein